MNPQTVDLTSPFDITGYATISGAELMQFISGLAPQAYIGWNVVTDDDVNGNPSVPNATITTKWKYYNWIRRAANGGVILYVWNPAAATDATLLNWQVANVSSIVAGSITGNQLADLTITGGKIALSTITWDKMTNGAAAGGALTGTFPNPSLGNRVVGSGNIALGAVVGGDPATASNLANQTVEGRNITQVDAKGIIDASVMSIAQAGGGLNPTGVTGKLKLPLAPAYGQVLRVANGGAAWESVFNSFVKDLSGDILTNNASKQIRVKSDVSGLEVFTPALANTMFTATSANAMDNATNGSSGTANAAINFAHGLGSVPTFVRAVLVCVITDATTGHVVGDEVPIDSCLASSVQAKSLMSVSADATKVYWNFNASSTGIQMLKPADGTRNTAIYANWKVKVYAAF